MRYVLVISPEALDVNPGAGSHNEGGVWFDAMGSDVSDWADEPERMARLEAMGSGRSVYAVHWRDLTVLKAVLAKVIPRDDVILDDDCGLFVSGSEFVTMSAENPGNRWWLGGHYA